MRILMLTDRFPPEARASGHLFHELGVGLVRRGHEVGVVTRMPGDYVPDGASGAGPAPALARERLDGIDVHRVRGLSALRRAPLMRAVDQFGVGLAFALRAREWPAADVALVYSPPLPLALAGVLNQRWRGVPWVLNLHDLYPQTAIDLGLLRNRFAIRLAEGMEGLAYRQAARIVVPAPRSREILVTRKGVEASKVEVVPNWVDVDGVLPGPRENDFRAAHGLGGRFIVSYAGVMGFAQDLAPLIAAARSLREREDIVFLLVGDGVHLGRWRRLAEGLGNVRFLPVQPKARYFDLLRASDVCVVPLALELESPAIPGKIQSIMAVARPVLAIVNPRSDAAGLIALSGCGLTVAPGDPDAVAAAILRLRGAPELGAALGASGRRYAAEHFSLDKAVAAYELVLVQAASYGRRAAGSAA